MIQKVFSLLIVQRIGIVVFNNSQVSCMVIFTCVLLMASISSLYSLIFSHSIRAVRINPITESDYASNCIRLLSKGIIVIISLIVITIKKAAQLKAQKRCQYRTDSTYNVSLINPNVNFLDDFLSCSAIIYLRSRLLTREQIASHLFWGVLSSIIADLFTRTRCFSDVFQKQVSNRSRFASICKIYFQSVPCEVGFPDVDNWFFQIIECPSCTLNVHDRLGSVLIGLGSTG